MNYKDTVIRIECTGSDILPLDAMEEFQGGLKNRTHKDIEKIIKSIIKYGFSFPFFVWQNEGHNWVLDGHGRIAALSEIRQKGCNLPLFPVIYVEAKDEEEAKNKLLRLNSQYGEITLEGLREFTFGLDIDFDELQLPSGTLSISENTENDDNEIEYKSKIELIIETENEEEANELYNEFLERGLKCRLSTL